MSKPPLFSFCIPTRNRAAHLEKALQSCLAQTYKNIEIVIRDNAGSDETEALIASYQKNHPFIRYFKNKENIGQTRNIFKVFEDAKGDYVQYLADDNWLDKNYAEEKIRRFEQNPQVGLVASRLEKIKIDGKIFAASRQSAGLISSDEVFRRFYKSDGWFGLISTARRGDLMEAVRALSVIPNPYGYDYQELAMAYDLLLFIYIMSKYPSMYFTDKTTYHDVMVPSEIAYPAHWVQYYHQYRVAGEYVLNHCNLNRYIPEFRRYLGALLIFTLTKERLQNGPRADFKKLPQFYEGYTPFEIAGSLFGSALLGLERIGCFTLRPLSH